MITKNELKQILQENLVVVNFSKVDGSEREMTCTLKKDLMTEYVAKDPTRKKPENDEILAVWDVNKNAFRSFRVSLVKDYKVVNELGKL